ncbi:acyl-CoA dehydrogenase family protein [Sphingobium sp. DEHP117]|uniref:acyl-CoA dehydrogenase family protein n=1 Tax=Sphingobium sp. DEHP117 TaxID=2993436 RepID=UPI0027D656EE|nr:acyl-CoA dehydrogenase family protein [Sphingobium sp. DEHP117]MDQ4420334.1 acyl-CoA dehydrogenase family protein [Sphingobium sp. DEHP117]
MIDFSELVDVARKMFPADQLAPERDRAWGLATEMGWGMIRVPEAYGGLQLGRAASTAIHYELGRVLSRMPMIPAQLGVLAVAASSMPDRGALLERMMGGEYISVPLLDPRIHASDGTISGSLHGVPDADMATHVLVDAANRIGLVSLAADGVALVERETWDATRRMFDILLHDVRLDSGMIMAEGAHASAIRAELGVEMHLALAADSLGGATAALEMSTEYLKTRQQFGRPLAMFQALKHRCADLKKEIALGDALLRATAADKQAGMVAAGALKSFAARIYRDVAEEAIQLHGGIGLTIEMPVHLFLKRAMLNCELGGCEDIWAERAGREMLARTA